MKKKPETAAKNPSEEIAELVVRLQETQQRLQELTGGEVDAVVARGGQSILLQNAQEKLRQSESNLRQLADTMMVILNALPAHIALLDARGVIISVNNAWEQFAQKNELQRPKFGVDQNYLKICEQFKGEGAEDAKATARGIRQVLQGKARQFSLEYPCHSPTEKHWFNLIVTPVREDRLAGAVVMHVDITSRKLAEEEILSKTALLEAQLNSTLDSIIIVDPSGKKLLHNHRAAELWKIPREIAEQSEYAPLLNWIADQIKNPLPFTEKVSWLNANPAEISLDEIELRDGRFFERYSAPVIGQEGKHYGRIWVSRDITERKVKEEKAIEQMKLLNMAGSVGKLGAWAAVYPGPKLIWSEEIYRIHEVGPEFKTDHESTLSFFLPESRRKLEEAIESKQPYDLELEIKTGQGNHRWVRTTSAVDLKDGEVQRLYGVFQDITEWKQTESRLRRLIDSNVQSVFFWKTNGEIIDANDAFLELVGYSREDLEAGRIRWKDLTPLEYAEADRHATEEIAAKGFCPTYEKEYIRKDGSRVPILIGAAIFDDNPNEGVCFVLNITERKRMESRFRRMVDSNAQGVMFWKSTGLITDGNDAFLGMVGYNREDLEAGRISWSAMTPPEYAEADRRALEEISATGVCTPLEKEWIRKDGSRVPVYLSAASFVDTPGEGVTFVLDLTERKKLEQQFLRAQRMESIGTLAGGIAHDLNNILAPIMMSIDILKLKATDPQVTNILQTLEVSSKRGADIVRQVLSFARGIEGERIEVQPKHLIKDIETIIRDTFPRNIQQEVSLPAEPWTIFGDPTLLHQILLNLCVNARDAMPGGGTLTLKVENCMLDQQYVSMNAQAKPGRYVLLSVTDTGAGIPPENIDKIFEPFFTTKEVGKGTGLGLSTVMGIVKSHDGVINVYSELGKGTTFRVYLPALETASKGLLTQTKSLSYPRGNGETVLVVDDEASVLTITSQTLQSFGYRVLTATDGAEAVAIYAEHRGAIDIVLTDMMMPIMDGTSVIRVLSRINPEIKIIASSGLTANGSGNKPPGLTLKYFLTKPYTAGTLLKTIKAILEEA